MTKSDHSCQTLLDVLICSYTVIRPLAEKIIGVKVVAIHNIFFYGATTRSYF